MLLFWILTPQNTPKGFEISFKNDFQCDRIRNDQIYQLHILTPFLDNGSRAASPSGDLSVCFAHQVCCDVASV